MGFCRWPIWSVSQSQFELMSGSIFPPVWFPVQVRQIMCYCRFLEKMEQLCEVLLWVLMVFWAFDTVGWTIQRHLQGTIKRWAVATERITQTKALVSNRKPWTWLYHIASYFWGSYFTNHCDPSWKAVWIFWAVIKLRQIWVTKKWTKLIIG